MRVAMLAILLCLSSQAGAHGEVLWQQIAEGMTVDQVHAIFPVVKGQVEWHREMTELKKYVNVGKCKADVHIRHDVGFVKSVVIFRQNKGMIVANCPDEILAGMSTKYGTPSRHVTRTYSFLGTDGQEDTYLWEKDHVAILLVLHGDPQNGAWDLKYISTSDFDDQALRDSEGL